MKIIHCADLHLDSKMETSLSSEQAANRRREILLSFENMIEYAKNEGVKVIIIAGDLYDTANDMQKTIKKRVGELIKNAPDIDFLYLRGNHDRITYFEDSIGEYSNLYLFTKKWTTYRYGHVVFSGIEFDDSYDDSIYSDLVLQENDCNIVIMHGQEAKYNAKDKTEIVNIPLLQNKFIDYLALGHIHTYKRVQLDSRGVYCYAGCLEGRGFDECGDKGFVMLEVDENAGYRENCISAQYISRPIRTLHTINVDISDVSTEMDIIGVIDRAVDNIDAKDMVKIVIMGEKSVDTDYDVLYIADRYKNRFYYSKVYDETLARIDYNEYKNDISLKGEYVRTVEATDMDEEYKKKVILTGIRALTGRDI